MLGFRVLRCCGFGQVPSSKSKTFKQASLKPKRDDGSWEDETLQGNNLDVI
jgi:hypothetical protein